MHRKKIAGQHRWRWKLAWGLCAFTLLLSLFKLHSFVNHPSHDSDPYQTASDEALLAPPKLAFLFIARNRILLDVVWELFFQGTEKGFFSVYIHSRPGFVYNKKTTVCKHFYNRQLANSILVDWGESSMIEAERLLLAEALKDPANERFLFVSDSCIPLYNFSYIYEYVMASPKSFVDSFLDAKESRYNPKMAPIIQRDKWRKGSQWCVLKRDHAAVVASDADVFPLFQKHCKRRPLPEFWRQEQMDGDPSKLHNCIPDEHYVQTLLAIRGYEGEIEPRTLTYTLWDQSGRARERKGWHPVTFAYSDATEELISQIKNIASVNYEMEYRTEWCRSNQALRPCFLFARKFTRGAAQRLLNQTILKA